MSIVLDNAFIERLAVILEKSIGDSSAPMGIAVTRKHVSDHVNFTDVVICGIGITGVFNGNLTLIIPQTTACHFVSKMIGMEFNEVTDDVLDGCRELTNMVAGVIKMEINSAQCDINIGIPTSLIGHTLHMRFNPSDKYVHQQYGSPEGDLEVYLVCRDGGSELHEQAVKPAAVKKDAAGALLERMKNNTK